MANNNSSRQKSNALRAHHRDEKEINDNQFENWLRKQFNTLKREYLSETEDKWREDLLFSLAKILRQYVNCTKTKQGGIQLPYRKSAHSMTEWVQKEMYKAPWSPKVTLISAAVLFARKFVGNLAIEGRSLRKPISAAERKKLDSVTRNADKRFNSSLSKLDVEDIDRINDLRDLGLVDDNPEMDTDSDSGELHGGDNGDT